MDESGGSNDPQSAYDSPTFTLDMSIRVDQPVGSMSISPCGRDVVLASRQGLHIIDLDSPYSPPRHLPHRTPWEVADVQWSPFAARDYWVVSTSNQKALVWNLAMKTPFNAIEHVLHAHARAITDINFSAHHPDVLATCAVDSFVHCWDLRNPARPSMTFCDWFAGATQVKWNRQDPHILASSHDKFLRIWDDRKGAIPLHSIEAHDTKIYGVDWNRVRPSSLATCSLDRSIKIWDYRAPVNEPERIIRTPFPVWRSRHTPFGWGLLAMPQRGNNDLHLFDRRLEPGTPSESMTPAVHRFEGHEDQVKEFLWRPRGNIVDGIDNREFQLVSWGTDRDLRLHHVDSQVLEKIGYEKGREVPKKYNFTRNNAKYKTFRDEETRSGSSRALRIGLGANADQGFSSALGGALNAGMKKVPIPLSRGWGDGGYMTSRGRMHGRRNAQKDVSALDWMQGVRIGKKGLTGGYSVPDSADGSKAALASADRGWDGPENLGDEINQTHEKFKKVSFEDVDVARRIATISLDGPWGPGGLPAYTKVDVTFPAEYPEKKAPLFRLEQTAAISAESLARLGGELDAVAASYTSQGKPCLEAVLGYLLGERTFDEALRWARGEHDDHYDAEVEAGASSSDDDEEVGALAGGPTQDLELSGTELMGTVNSNANVPLPKACGALFAPNGSLICFFPPKAEKSWPGLAASKEEESRNGKGWRIFQGFGRLRRASPSVRNKSLLSHDAPDEEEDDSADDSFTSSSDSSDGSTRAAHAATNLFTYTHSWRHRMQRSFRPPRTRSTDYSQRSAGRSSGLGKLGTTKVKSIVSIHNLEHLLPAKRRLAEDMIIVGDAAAVCEHNARVAARQGFHQLADVWHLGKLILHREVPLEVFELHQRKEPIFVVAHHASTRLKRRDSGLDLAFDEGPQSPTTALTGRVRWGQHPAARGWLIDAIFAHFERLADVQMLAMLSCVFHDPIETTRPSSPALDRVIAGHRPRRSPAYSMEHFPAQDIPWSLRPPTFSISSTPRALPSPTGASGSLESSTGLWSGEATAPHSTGTTPPLYYKGHRSSTDQEGQTQSLSTSPNLRFGRHSTSSLTGAFAASLSRPFTTVPNSSPPAEISSGRRSKGGGDNVGGVTWGTNTIFGPASKAASEASLSDSESDLERPSMIKPAHVKVTLHNKDLFDMEGHASTALLHPSQTRRYQAYREEYANLLVVWGLVTRQLEMLQYRGLDKTSVASDGCLAALEKRHSDWMQEEPWQGLGIAQRCASCGEGLMRRRSDGGAGLTVRCQRCSRGRERMTCSLCKEKIRGTYAPCLICGHVMHSACHQGWFGEHDSGCPTGCGCVCAEMTLEPPPIATHDRSLGSKDVENRLATVVEAPETPLSNVNGWERIESAGRSWGLTRDSSHRDSHGSHGGEPLSLAAKKKADSRPVSSMSSQNLRRQLVRTFSRDAIA